MSVYQLVSLNKTTLLEIMILFFPFFQCLHCQHHKIQHVCRILHVVLMLCSPTADSLNLFQLYCSSYSCFSNLSAFQRIHTETKLTDLKFYFYDTYTIYCIRKSSWPNKADHVHAHFPSCFCEHEHRHAGGLNTEKLNTTHTHTHTLLLAPRRVWVLWRRIVTLAPEFQTCSHLQK